MSKRMTQAEFDETLREFRNWIGRLMGCVDQAFPDGFIYDPEVDEWMKTGQPFYNPRMEMIAKGIDNVLGSFDGFQEKLGLPKDYEPRHRRFLTGKCSEE
ncbi:MAG: hypothetical protein ACLQGP_03205 [Isosphaeraceae bacterium]